MPVTKAQADYELVDRVGGVLTFAARSVATDGTNPATVGPLREGLSSLGLSTVSFAAVTDSDLSGVANANLPQLLDVAELRLLRNAAGWLTKVDQRISMGEQKLHQVREDVAAAILDLEARTRILYGYGLGSVTAGRVDLGFAQTDPCQGEPLYDGGGPC